MKKNRLFITLVTTCLCLLAAQGDRTEINVDFRVGSGTLDPAFGDNAARLSQIITLLKDVGNCDTLELTGVTFCGSASPEGPFKLNRKLAEARLSALESYVRQRAELPDSIVGRCDAAIGWERLAALVEQSDMAHKEEALHILRDVPEFTYNSRVRSQTAARNT